MYMGIKPNGTYISIITEGDLKDLAYILSEFGTEIAIDTETTGLEYLKAELLGISITHRGKLGYYIPVKRHATQLTLWDNPKDYLDIDIVREHLNPILSDINKIKILHNAKYDLHILHRHGFDLREPIFDTMIGAWVLGNVHGARYGLKELSENKFNISMTTFKDLVGKGSFEDVPLRDATDYAGPDADMTKRLYDLEMETLKSYEFLRPVMELEMKCMLPLKKMEEVGALIDVEYLEKLEKPLAKQMAGYENIVHQHFGDFNINSNEQLLDKINRHLKLKIEDTKFETIVKYKDDFPVLEAYLRWGKRQKLHSVYVIGILERLDESHRVHTEFQQNKKTGRLSSNNPNLQNIPTKKDEDEYAKDLPSIRKAFIVKEGCKFVSIDYSQLELRITAHRADETPWIEAYKKGTDIHKATAAAVFKIPISQVTKEQRFKAKAVNFGLLYGMSEYGLARRIKVSVDEAKEFINRYFENLPNIQKYIADRKREVIEKKYVETDFGRRLYFKYDLTNPKSLPAAQREGINMPIQGQAADIVKKAMVEVDSLLDNYKSKLILQVHDELDFEMYEEEMPILIPQIVDIMSNVFTLKVPLQVDVEYGDNWEQLRDWKDEN